jgi:alpha-tubulin suppressor-like RCC1 family protein
MAADSTPSVMPSGMPLQSLRQLLSEDNSLYTSLLPKEIVGLICNYVVSRGFVFGSNKYFKLGLLGNKIFGPVELNYNVKDLAFGQYHTLLLTNEGELYISGSNDDHQFGINADEEQILLTEYPSIYVHLHAGGDLLRRAKSFINISELKANILMGGKIIKIATGPDHSLIITESNDCYSFGSNRFGKLGTDRKDAQSRWNYLAGNIKDIGCGYYHSCYLTMDGNVYVFGSNFRRQLGLGPGASLSPVFQPRLLSGFSNIQQIIVSHHKTGLITNTNGIKHLYVCGFNSEHALGLPGVDNDIDTPTIVLDEFDQPIVDIQKVCFGSDHMLILSRNRLYVCGTNTFGQLGLGEDQTDTPTIIDKPKILDDVLDLSITDIACGIYSSYIVADKICYATGSNVVGELGMGDTNDNTAFSELPMFTNSFVNSNETV